MSATAKGEQQSRFDSYSVRNSVFSISRITFRDCRVHILSDNLSRNSCIQILRYNRRAFCMRMRQHGLLKCHRGIFCELFTFSTSICRPFSGAE